MSYEISIIHPSRQRPEQALETAKKWMKDVDPYKTQYRLSLDTADPTLDRYKEIFSGADFPCEIIISDNKNAIQAINEGAKYSTGNILIVVSDDFDCPPNWYTLLLSVLLGKSDYLVKTDDGLQPFIITLPIMDRAYYNRFGYIYYPEYKHMFCDTEMSCVGAMLGKTINVNLSFKHNHYSTGRFVKDEISVKNDATWTQGETLFNERKKHNFYLTEFTNPCPL